MTSVKMPKIGTGKCSKCAAVSEYYFNQYGATEPCDSCGAPSIEIMKVA